MQWQGKRSESLWHKIKSTRRSGTLYNPTNSQVGPRYKELRYLGEGAYGVVAEALDTKTWEIWKLRWFYFVECCIWISLCQCIALMQERKSCNQEDFAVWAPDLLSGKNQTCCQVKRRSMPFLPIRKILLFRILNIQNFL